MLHHQVFISGVFSSAVYFLMLFRNRSACLTFIALLLALLPASGVSQETSWQKETASWREQHKADLLKPDGWLSLVGLEWLQPGDNSAGSAPDNKIHLPTGPAHLAIFHLEGETVTLNPPAGDSLRTSSSPVLPQNRRLCEPRRTRTKFLLVSPSVLSTCT